MHHVLKVEQKLESGSKLGSTRGLISMSIRVEKAEFRYDQNTIQDIAGTIMFFEDNGPLSGHAFLEGKSPFQQNEKWIKTMF